VEQADNPGTGSDQPIDRSLLLAQVEGDLELLREITGLFFADYPRRLHALESAVARGDAQGVSLVAHSIKGSVANLAAPPAFRAAERLEQMGRRGDLSGAAAACAALQAEIERLRRALLSVAGEAPAAPGE